MSIAECSRLPRSARIATAWLLLVVAAALAAVATACGGGSSAKPTPTSVATEQATSTIASTPTPQPTAQALIDNALLDVPDMPAGWQAAFAAASSLDLTLNLCNQHIDDSGYVAHGQTALTAGQDALLERIAVYAASRAADVVSTARSAFGACTEWTATRGGQSIQFRASALPFRALGDETLAYTLSASGPGGASAGSQVYVIVRRGATVMTVSYLSTGAVDAASVENLVRGAFNKLEKTQSAPTS